MKHTLLALAGVTFLSTAAMAENTVRVMTGGVGENSKQAIEQAQKDYSLKLLFTGEGGMFLANVRVIIRDKEGMALVDGVSEGPYLLADLEPGTYTIEAEAGGFNKKQKITIAKGLKSYNMQFPVKDNGGDVSLREHLEQNGFEITMYFQG